MYFRKLKTRDRITDLTVWVRIVDGIFFTPDHTNSELRLVNPLWLGHRAGSHIISGDSWKLYDLVVE